MKNIIIAAFTTYVFWTDFAEIHPLPVLPLIFVTFWLIIAGIDDLITDYMNTVRKGQRLQRKIRRLEKEVN